MNLGKTEYMTYMPGFIWGEMGNEAYMQRVTGEGANFWEWNRTRVSCGECGMAMLVSSL